MFSVASPMDDAIITPPPTLDANAILLFVFKFFNINLSARKTVDAQITGFSIVAEKNLFLID